MTPTVAAMAGSAAAGALILTLVGLLVWEEASHRRGHRPGHGWALNVALVMCAAVAVVVALALLPAVAA